MRMISRVALALSLFLCGCVTVRSSTSPGANLSQYRTFGWFEPATVSQRQLAFERSPAGAVVRQQIASDLQAKGLQETQQNPDILVSYHSKLQNKINVTDWGYGGFWWGGPGGVSVDEYTQGTLFVDLINPQTKQVVWRGTASAVVNDPYTPNEKKLASAVHKVMERYPVEMAAVPRPAM